MKKEKWVVIAILIFVCLLRVVAIDKLPVGLNVDEASSGYEAFSILNYGIDRNGNFLPVFLEAWRKWPKCFIYVYYDTFCKITWVKYLVN